VTRVAALGLAAASAAALVVVGLVADGSGWLFPLRFSIQRNPELLPSSQAVPGAELRRGLPTLSLHVDPPDLYDPKTGILANKHQHGRAWERRGSVSYLDGGRVRFASPTGVRVHGGGSRITSPRQGYRLYFRRGYGASTVPPGLLFAPPHEHPLRVLIVHNDIRTREGGQKWSLVNPLAFDIATRVGGTASPSRPVRFLLNGEFQGVFVLYEHFTPEHYFATHGQRSIALKAAEFVALYDQIHALAPFDARTVGDVVDLESLLRWFMATAFCGTRDAFQGPGQFRDASRARAQWFWVNWDMDGSFGNVNFDPFRELLLPPGVEHRGRRHDEVRPYILTRLIAEDPAFKRRFEEAWIEAMVYRLNPDFLHERFEHYRDVAVTYGVRPQTYLPVLEDFLRRRPAVLRSMAERYLGTPTFAVRVNGPQPVRVNGHDVGATFDGYAFRDMQVTFSLPPESERRFDYWRINGQPHARKQATVTVTATADLLAQPIYR
jgi:hypothetical protein